MKKFFLATGMKAKIFVCVPAILGCAIGKVVFAQGEKDLKIENLTDSQKSHLHGIVYKWYLPSSMEEEELINDFKVLERLAAQHGALSSKLFRTGNKGEYIGLQFWPSLQIYNDWFDQKNFRFRQPQSKEVMDLIKKINDVYKNQFLDEIKEIV